MRISQAGMHRALMRTAAVAVCAGLAATALAGPASAEILDRHLMVDCPAPYSQNCPVRHGLTVRTTGPLYVSFTGDPTACAAGKARVFVDGREWGGAIVQPGGNDGGYYSATSAGIHNVEIQMDGVVGGCNTGSMSGWSGDLHVETNEDALDGAE